MAKIETISLGNLRTEVVHTQSGTKIVTDAPTDNKGQGQAFSPTDLLAASLGCCLMTMMDMYARDHGMDLTGTRMVTEKFMASDPRRIGEIKIDVYFNGDFTEKQQTILRRVAETCPVGRSLHPDLKQTINFYFGE